MNNELLKQIQYLSNEDMKTLSQKAGKITEELGELFKALLPYENAAGTSHRFSSREKLLEECSDIMLAALSVAYHLNYSHDEIETMMKIKAEKWYRIQEKEREINYPIPFEIHVTLKHCNENSKIDIANFTKICKQIGVKPILLDLHTKNGTVEDIMTSSTHFGTNRSAYDEAERIRNVLLHVAPHVNVIRVKIESIPQHPMAPKYKNDIMPKGCYFESHIPLLLTSSTFDGACIVNDLKIKNNLSIHISQNALKKQNDSIMMITFRDDKTYLQQFLLDVVTIEMYLIMNNYNIGKIHNEFSVYDTNVDHDNLWIDN